MTLRPSPKLSASLRRTRRATPTISTAMEMEKPVSLCLGARKLLHPDIMSERWYPRALLVLLTVPSESTPATAQETYCIEPGMDFKAAEERLMEVGELQSRSGAQGIYRATYQPERGLVTIAASEGAFGRDRRRAWSGPALLFRRGPLPPDHRRVATDTANC
jgi:hypothetical protein